MANTYTERDIRAAASIAALSEGQTWRLMAALHRKQEGAFARRAKIARPIMARLGIVGMAGTIGVLPIVASSLAPHGKPLSQTVLAERSSSGGIRLP